MFVGRCIKETFYLQAVFFFSLIGIKKKSHMCTDLSFLSSDPVASSDGSISGHGWVPGAAGFPVSTIQPMP